MNGINDWKLYAIVALVAAMSGIGVPRLLPDVAYRPDPWTGRDAKAAHERLERDLMKHVESQLSLHELRLLSNMPGAGTRQRIVALEREMSKVSPGFIPGAFNFSHSRNGGGGSGGE